VTSEVYTAECKKGAPLELSTGSHRYESVMQFHIGARRGQLFWEKVLYCVKIIYICIYVHMWVDICVCT
jgi:hypothetical protein